MEIGIIKHSGNYKVQFSHGSQCFILSIDNDNVEEAEWVKRQLAICFNRAFGWSEDESALPIDNVSESVLFPEYCVDCINHPAVTEEKHHKCISCKHVNNKQTNFEKRV